MGGKGGGGSAPYQEELAGMFAGQNMMNMAARNPNAASMFRPGSKLGDSYKDLFGTSNLPAEQTFQLPNLGIASEAMSRVYGTPPPRFAAPQQQQWGLTRAPIPPPGAPPAQAQAPAQRAAAPRDPRGIKNCG